MAAVFNVRSKARVDSNGVTQRQKYQGVLAVSLAYGLYLGDVLDEYGSFKAFFLMNSFVPGTEIITPSEIRSSPRLSSVSLEVLPFSKKFTISEDFVDFLSAGQDYWFLYTSEPITKVINSKMMTYEQLDLICIADVSGPDGIRSLIPLLKLQKASSSS